MCVRHDGHKGHEGHKGLDLDGELEHAFHTRRATTSDASRHAFPKSFNETGGGGGAAAAAAGAGAITNDDDVNRALRRVCEALRMRAKRARDPRVVVRRVERMEAAWALVRAEVLDSLPVAVRRVRADAAAHLARLREEREVRLRWHDPPTDQAEQ